MTDTATPRTTGSGSGATPAEIGAAVASMLRGQTKDREIWDAWWDDERIESIEGDGSTWTGRAALDAKNQAWEAENEILDFRISGPFVGATGFALHFDVKLRNRNSGDTMQMSEVGVYTVENGKVVREEFMYSHE